MARVLFSIIQTLKEPVDAVKVFRFKIKNSILKV